MTRGFPLAGLLRLRNLQEEQAAAELARAHADRERVERRRRETAEILASGSLPDRSDERTWRAAVAARAALSSLTMEATAAAHVAARLVEASTADWNEARTRSTALGRLEERHDAVVRAEDEHAEQLVLDEAATRRHGTQGDGPGRDALGSGRATAGPSGPDPTHPGHFEIPDPTPAPGST